MGGRSSIERKTLSIAVWGSVLFHLGILVIALLPIFTPNVPSSDTAVSLQYTLDIPHVPSHAAGRPALQKSRVSTKIPILLPKANVSPPLTDEIARVVPDSDTLLILPESVPKKEIEFWRLTFNEIDSLGKEHPELKEAIFKEALTQSILRKDSIHWIMNKPIREALAAMNYPVGVEAQMVYHQKVFGTPYNPMRPAPPPNSVNMLSILPALENIWRAIVGR